MVVKVVRSFTGLIATNATFRFCNQPVRIHGGDRQPSLFPHGYRSNAQTEAQMLESHWLCRCLHHAALSRLTHERGGNRQDARGDQSSCVLRW